MAKRFRMTGSPILQLKYIIAKARGWQMWREGRVAESRICNSGTPTESQTKLKGPGLNGGLPCVGVGIGGSRNIEAVLNMLLKVTVY